MEKAEKNEGNQVKTRMAERSFNGEATVLCGNQCLCRCVSPYRRTEQKLSQCDQQNLRAN